LSFRWRGDYGGKKQQWFPSNYVEEIEDEAAEAQPLGSLQKGMLDLSGVTVGKEVLLLSVHTSSCVHISPRPHAELER
jgi:hypothetical protein